MRCPCVNMRGSGKETSGSKNGQCRQIILTHSLIHARSLWTSMFCFGAASGIWLNSREKKVWFLSYTWNPFRERRQMYLQLGLEQARKEARGVVVNIPIDFYQYLLNNEHEYLRDNHTYKFGDFFWKLPTFFRKSVFMIVPIWVSGKLLLLEYS